MGAIGWVFGVTNLTTTELMEWLAWRRECRVRENQNAVADAVERSTAAVARAIDGGRYAA